MEAGQGLRDGGRIGARERGQSEQKLDPLLLDQRGQPLPKPVHGRPAAMLRQKAGPPDFEEPPPRPPQSRKIELVFAGEAAGGTGPVLGHHPRGAHHLPIAERVEQQQMPTMVVELIRFLTRRRLAAALPAKLLNEHAVAQGHCGPQVRFGARPSQKEWRQEL